jgi:ABC-type nickel/cobalt efflux system permease component RcnA
MTFQVVTLNQTGTASINSSSRANVILDYLKKPLSSPLSFFIIFLTAIGLGAAHALTPGHGKTLLAAYLVGERAKYREAISLGLVITFTHTFSVVIIGLLLITASHFLLTNNLIPIIEVIAGAAGLLLGLNLFLKRFRELRLSKEERAKKEAAHIHAHQYGLPHDHDEHSHHSSHHEHKQSKFGRLTLGISGGIVPCPEALTVLLLAIALHRAPLGLAIVLAFSLGLALVLVGLGIVLVTPQIGKWLRLNQKKSRVSELLPVLSAVVVTIMGIGLIYQAQFS